MAEQILHRWIILMKSSSGSSRLPRFVQFLFFHILFTSIITHMKKILTFLILSTAICASAQQGPNVPKDYSFKKAEDYKTYQQNVIDCIKWLRSTHPDFKADERKAAAAFILQWTTGSPDVSVQLGTKYLPTSQRTVNSFTALISLKMENGGKLQDDVKKECGKTYKKK